MGLFVACGGDDGGGDGDGDGDGSGGNEPGDGDGDGSGGNEPGDGDGDGSGGRASGGMGGESENLGGGGMGGEGSGETCDETVEFPTALSITPRDDTNEWGADDFDSATISYTECGAAIVTATLPHEDEWEGGDPGEANNEATKFEVQAVYYPVVDLTDKVLNLTIKLLDDGRGPAAENGGYNVYLGAVEHENGWTQVSTPYDGANDNVSGDSNYPGYSGSLYNANDEIKLSLVIPSDNADFDPSNVYKLSVSIQNKYWDGTAFDYDEAVFEISNLSVDDAP